jgi:hypothetical protein
MSSNVLGSFFFDRFLFPRKLIFFFFNWAKKRVFCLFLQPFWKKLQKTRFCTQLWKKNKSISSEIKSVIKKNELLRFRALTQPKKDEKCFFIRWLLPGDILLFCLHAPPPVCTFFEAGAPGVLTYPRTSVLVCSSFYF